MILSLCFSQFEQSCFSNNLVLFSLSSIVFSAVNHSPLHQANCCQQTCAGFTCPANHNAINPTSTTVNQAGCCQVRPEQCFDIWFVRCVIVSFMRYMVCLDHNLFSYSPLISQLGSICQWSLSEIQLLGQSYVTTKCATNFC